VLSYELDGDMLTLRGRGPGAVVLELTTPAGEPLRLRVHVDDDDTAFLPPAPHFFRGGVFNPGGLEPGPARSRVRAREHVRVGGVLCPYLEQTGEEVDVMVVVKLTLMNGENRWFYLTGPGEFTAWDKRADSLRPFQAGWNPSRGQFITLFLGPMPGRGEIRIFTGYATEDGLVYDTQPELVTVEE
jgi:hypothetical protein